MGQGYSCLVEGTVAPGYEPVKEMFTDNFKQGKETNAQLCVYVGEEKVVDLWGSLKDKNYNGDCLTNVFSSTKSLAALALSTLVDRGLIKYTDRICEYWPEFAQNGKGDVTVADLMRHEAGLAAFDTTLGPEDFSRQGIKENRVGSVIERQKQDFPPTQRRQYHAVTRGWIINEIFRRVEPTGITIGEFLESNVSRPFQAGVHIGGSPAATYYPVESIGLGYVVGQSLIPESVGRAVEPNFIELLTLLNNFRKFLNMAKDAGKPPVFSGMDRAQKCWNSEWLRQGELPSANGNCSARGLAKVAAVMANGGSFQGQTLLSPEGWKQFHAEPIDGKLMTQSVKFTQGGIAQFEEEDKKGRHGYFGWMGLGGSVFQWHPELKIGMAYVPTLLTWIDLTNNKARLLQEEVARCAAKVSNNLAD